MKKIVGKTLLVLAAFALIGCSNPGGSSSSSSSVSSSSSSSSSKSESGISLSERKISLQVGKTYALSPIGATGSVTYSSNDSSVATITSDGVVTAISVGTAIVKAKDSLQYALLEVNVIAASAEAILNIDLGVSSLSLSEGDVYQLSPTISNGDETVSVTPSYSSSDSSIVNVSEAGLISAIKKGSATINVSAKYGDKDASAFVAITVTEFKVSLVPTFTERQIVKGDEPLALTFVASGRTGELTIDEGSLVLTSSDSSIASVSDDKLTANKKGTITINATAKVNGASVSTTLNIKVRERYTVSYANVSTPIASENVLDGEKIVTKPTDPSKAGYVFSGWTSNGVDFDFDSSVESDTVLSPHFLAIVGSSTSNSVATNAFLFSSIDDFVDPEFSGYNFYNDGSEQVKKEGEALINIQTADKLEFNLGFPLLDYSSLSNVYFTLAFGYNDISAKVGDDTLVTAGSYSYSVALINESGEVNAYVDGTKALTLSDDVANGTKSLTLKVIRTAVDLYASVRISPIMKNVLDYQSLLAASLTSLSAVATGEETSHFTEFASYEGYLAFMTEEEKASYTDPEAITRFKTAFGSTSSSILTYEVAEGRPDGFATDATYVAGQSDSCLHFQLQAKGDPYKTSYYISFPAINYLSYAETDFYYGYGYDVLSGSVAGENAFALVSGGNVYAQAMALKNEDGSIVLYTEGVKKLTLNQRVASGQEGLRFDIEIASGQDYSEIRFSGFTAHF